VGWGLVPRKTKSFISVRIKSAGGLDYFHLKEFPRIPFSMMVTILNSKRNRVC